MNVGGMEERVCGKLGSKGTILDLSGLSYRAPTVLCPARGVAPMRRVVVLIGGVLPGCDCEYN